MRLLVYITGMVNQRLLLVLFENTWSCYTGGQTDCGRCGTCAERIEAFQIAGVHDPTEYVSAVAKDA